MDAGEQVWKVEWVASMPPIMSSTTDRRDRPMYSIAEAAGYLGMPASTLKSWVFGRTYTTLAGESRVFKPLIEPADRADGALSFFNVVEVHILLSTRKIHGINMGNVRSAIDYVRDRFPANRLHPLLTQEFHTDGKHLFIKNIEETINASKKGQAAFGEIVNSHLELIGRDADGMPASLYPGRGNRVIVMNPSISSGRPVVSGTGVMASIIAQRVAAGESPHDIAANYGIRESAVAAAIEYAKAA